MKQTELRSALPDLPCDGDQPVFNAPWEAQAFAMTLALHERGMFDWNEWAASLIGELCDLRLRHKRTNVSVFNRPKAVG